MRAVPALVIIFAALVFSRPVVAQPTRATVAVDFAALDEAAYKRLNALKLEERVVLRLAQEGFAVVVSGGKPQILLTLQVLPDRVIIADAAAPGERRREVPTVDEPVRELTHLEIAQKIVELARASRAALPPPPPAPVLSTAAVVPADDSSRIGFEIGGGGAALLRAGGLDPLARLDLRFSFTDALGLRAGGGVAPASGGEVRVVESEFQVGPSYRYWPGRRFSIEGAALFGAMLHAYALDDGDALAPVGRRFDVLASLPVAAVFWPAETLGIELRVAPGIAGGAREHTIGGQPLWQRGGLRVEAGAALVWRIR